MPKKKINPLPSLEVLRAALAYEPHTGLIRHKQRPLSEFNRQIDGLRWNGRYAGTPAGYKRGEGYYLIRVAGAQYYAHRIAWALYHGVDPGELEIDHKNGNRADNRLSNLRAVSHKINARNASRPRKNKSGIAGVVWNPKEERWMVYATENGRPKYLGRSERKEDAVALRTNWLKTVGRKLGYTDRHGQAVMGQYS